MPQTFRAGVCSVTVDQDELIRHLDRVTDGAATRFVRRTTDGLEAVRQSALPLWPVRRGVSKAALRVETKLTDKAIEVSILDDARGSWGFYAYKIKFSELTEQDIDDHVRAFAERGTTPEAEAKIAAWEYRKMWRRHGHGAPSEALAGKNVWGALVRPGAKALKTSLLPELQDDLLRLARG